METMAAYLDNGWAPLHALRRHHDKYILAPRPEYYDLAADPLERKNLFVEKAGGELARISPTGWRRLPRPRRSPPPRRNPTRNPSRKLQALGYLSGAGAPSRGETLPDPKDMIEISSSRSSLAA